MPTKGFVVYGRVQGVGFRYHVQSLAERLGVTGEVWNRRDGAVEAIATHPDLAVLQEFQAGLHNGPGYVKGVEDEPLHDQLFESFEVTSTRF